MPQRVAIEDEVLFAERRVYALDFTMPDAWQDNKRVREALRVSTQLLEAPSGTVLWSHSAQVTLGDIFQLQDTLARQIDESLALPLSGRERRAFGHDVPSNAKAYGFYLRANPLSHESGSWEVARDLYLQCLQADPHYAPA